MEVVDGVVDDVDDSVDDVDDVDDVELSEELRAIGEIDIDSKIGSVFVCEVIEEGRANDNDFEVTDAVCEIIEKGETCDDFGILDDDNDDKLVVGSETECEILEKGETFDDC